jgi:hypothetical protein
VKSGGGRQREFCQAGVELLGLSSAESDAEVIALAISAATQDRRDRPADLDRADGVFQGPHGGVEHSADDAEDISRHNRP